ncbi:acetylxylan esterase [Nonomuraea sp. B1E8]|uniref:acetylxylan esterase n=1 Tax=unclassified Nonomuraea TaxID=2593643 RepID=UPI00325F684B
MNHAAHMSHQGARVHHAYPFDPTHGYDLDGLLAVPAPEEPDGFADFWRGLRARAAAVDVDAWAGPPEGEADGVVVRPVRYTSLGGVRLGGWLTVPADGRVTRGCVVGHGYGGRDGVGPLPLTRGTAAIWPCARGLGDRGTQPGIPSDAARHVLHGIESRDTYVHGGCAADLWCAATALLDLVPEAAGRLDYIGASFGGGIGALALPWDDRFTAAALVVPSFGAHPLRLTLPCTGSGEAVRARHASHPETAGVLRYFDAATAAARITIPVHVAAALFDPAVPPPGQFAVHNALAGPRELHVLETGHHDHPGVPAAERRLAASQRAFLCS